MIWNDFSAECVAIISVQAAMIETVKTPAPLKPPLPNCPQCKGSGKIRTGDNQNWTNCPCTERSDSKKP